MTSKMEYTFLMIKPDGVKRNLMNAIFETIKKNSFEILECKEILPDKKTIEKHLDFRPRPFDHTAQKTVKLCQKKNIDLLNTSMANKSISEIGQMIREMYVDYLSSGKIIVALLKGENSIFRLKEICGETFPKEASENSIRGQYGSDSFEICIQENRAAHNIVHSPETMEEANHQINLWFPDFI